MVLDFWTQDTVCKILSGYNHCQKHYFTHCLLWFETFCSCPVCLVPAVLWVVIPSHVLSCKIAILHQFWKVLPSQIVVSHQFWSCFACELLIPKQFSPVFTKFWIWNYDFTPVFALFWLQFTDPPRVNWKIVLFYFGNIYDLCWIDRNEYIYIYTV